MNSLGRIRTNARRAPAHPGAHRFGIGDLLAVLIGFVLLALSALGSRAAKPGQSPTSSD